MREEDDGLPVEKHTGGDWEIGTSYGLYGVNIFGDGGNINVCGIAHVERDVHDRDGRKTGSVPLERGWADAYLIKAAPKLLRLARMVVDGTFNDCDVRKAAEAAVAVADEYLTRVERSAGGDR